MRLKDSWIKDRAEDIKKLPSTVLVCLAGDNNIPIDDLTTRGDLARGIAEAEWGGRDTPTYGEAALPEAQEDFAVTTAGYEAPSAEAPWKEYPLADVTGVPFEEAESLKDEEVAALLAKKAQQVGPQPQTSSGHFIYEVLLPEFLERFFAKNADYGDQHRTGLGTAAEFVGIHRKVEKLKAALWDGREMLGEGVREMLFDLIGQCFIILDLMAMEEAKKQ